MIQGKDPEDKVGKKDDILLENCFKDNAIISEYKQQIFKTVVTTENYICTN